MNVKKGNYFNNTPADCQLIVKGVVPPTEVHLSTSCSCDNLTLVGTIISRSSDIKTALVAVNSGNCSFTYIAISL